MGARIETRDSRGGIQAHSGARGWAGRTGVVDKRSLAGAVLLATHRVVIHFNQATVLPSQLALPSTVGVTARDARECMAA